jgi:hypothetical protein
MSRNALVFGFGLAVALVAGWVVFPRVLYVQKQQPLEFRHKTHAEKSGVADCGECHSVREDGAFAGIPAMEKCASCHSERIGESKDEATLVNHVKRDGLACTECHSTYGTTDQVRVYQLNRISGYSRDIWGHSISRLRRAPHEGMKMSDCEDCHRRHNVEVGCLGCHK